MADQVKLDPAAAAPIKEHFRDLAAEFDNTRPTVQQHAAAVDDACGQFQGSCADGTDAYLLAWGQTMAFCGETSALIAGNINVFEIELTRLDEDAAHLPSI